MFMLVKINKKSYQVNSDEFTHLNVPEFSNIKILNDLGPIERLVAVFAQLKNCNINNLIIFNNDHGGFLPIECAPFFDKILLLNTLDQHINNINYNIAQHNIQNIFITEEMTPNVGFLIQNNIVFSDSVIYSDQIVKNYKSDVFICKNNLKMVNADVFSYVFQLKDSDYFIHMNENRIELFKETFKYFLELFEGETVCNYNNLIHLCIMVKNAGPQFEDMLTRNLPIIDKWTILDTGSTDDTIDIINKVLVGKKEGHLYQEPFINFKDSRNRCLDLAGTSCKFIIMLDDTYVMEGDLRKFLSKVRGDQLADSFTLFIKSDDLEYGSNRIIKSSSGLRYLYKVHEVISDKNNLNIIIPKDCAIIKDDRFDYMQERTIKRKELDLKFLYEEVEENPNEARTYYYLAQTYNILENYELAFEFFLKRASFTNSGYIQERYDAVFEAARLANFKLNKPWYVCLELYEKAYKIDESRPEALYFIGIHYMETDIQKTYSYFKKAFEIGYPIHCQYGLKPTLSFHFIPKFLSRICYEIKDFELGLKVSEFFLQNNNSDADSYQEIASWYNIYLKLNMCPVKMKPNIPVKPIFCFVADGGFEPWSGKNLFTTGVGGSETYIIEMANYIQASGEYDVIVFCNCLEEEVCLNVHYKPLQMMFDFIYKNYIHTCIVSRFSEYLPAVFNGWTENVYLVVHDLCTSGIVIPQDNKLKNIFCLTEWHVNYFNQIFPTLSHLTTHFYYGIDFCKFKQSSSKIPYKFIYSSFPNRGLLPLLKMWPQIYEKQPLATLHIYCDLDGKWVNSVEPVQIQMIKNMLESYYTKPGRLGIYYYGWVKKEELANAWNTADIWFYPCIFMETFCLTALEAALTKTFVITNDLAALQNTVSNRGVVINGNAMDDEWQKKALEKIFYYIDPVNKNEKNKFIEINYEWASKLSWENQAKKLLTNFISQSKIEKKFKYDWTNNKPNKEETETFLNILNNFSNNYALKKNSNIQILEIGVHTGTSLINIVKFIPNSYGCGIDKWSNETLHTEVINKNNNKDELEVEKSFYKNIITCGLKDRITGIKGSAEKIMLNMIKNGDMFDFIYINDIHSSLIDFYTILFLSWQILNSGGILVCECEFNVEDKNTPLYKFLLDNDGQYKILHLGCRLFIEKK
jgi:hypothetical protein